MKFSVSQKRIGACFISSRGMIAYQVSAESAGKPNPILDEAVRLSCEFFMNTYHRLRDEASKAKKPTPSETVHLFEREKL